MDTGKGYFEQLRGATEQKSDVLQRFYDGAPNLPLAEHINREMQRLANVHPNHGGGFTEGEELEIRGSRFSIEQIRPRGMVLLLLPKQGNMCDQK